MTCNDLLRAGRIRRERISKAEIRRALERAERDLKVARKIMAEDWDWGFAVAYNAVLQASRAFMFARGYRPASAEGHKTTFAFVRATLGRGHESLITYFDRMRRKRNQAIYDVAGIITETEARALFAKAQPAFLTRYLSSEGATGCCRRRKPPDKGPQEPSPGGAADGPLFRPFGAGPSVVPDPAAYAAG